MAIVPTTPPQKSRSKKGKPRRFASSRRGKPPSARNSAPQPAKSATPSVMERPSARVLLFSASVPIGHFAHSFGMIRFSYQEASQESGHAIARKACDCMIMQCHCGKPFFPLYQHFIDVIRARVSDDDSLPPPDTQQPELRSLHCGCRNASGVMPSPFDYWMQSVPAKSWPKTIKRLFLPYLKQTGKIRDYISSKNRTVSKSAAKNPGTGLQFLHPVKAGDPILVKLYYGADYHASAFVDPEFAAKVEKSPVSGYVCKCNRCSRTALVLHSNFHRSKSCGCQKRKDLSGKWFGDFHVSGPCVGDVIPLTEFRWMAKCSLCETEMPLTASQLQEAAKGKFPCGACDL